jgi:hypothetical protein
VYERISQLRHAINGKKRREPVAHETPAAYLASLD